MLELFMVETWGSSLEFLTGLRGPEETQTKRRQQIFPIFYILNLFNLNFINNLF
jgi:hypothetical protein